MSEELKPCPFCGGPVKLEKAHIHRSNEFGRRQFWGIVCRNTTNLGGSCCMEQVPSASKEAAITRWNTRAKQPVASEPSSGERAAADSRGMFVARLENMARNGDKWLTVEAVLALLNDCDMLASAALLSSDAKPASEPSSGERA